MKGSAVRVRASASRKSLQKNFFLPAVQPSKVDERATGGATQSSQETRHSPSTAGGENSAAPAEGGGVFLACANPQPAYISFHDWERDGR